MPGMPNSHGWWEVITFPSRPSTSSRSVSYTHLPQLKIVRHADFNEILVRRGGEFHGDVLIRRVCFQVKRQRAAIE